MIYEIDEGDDKYGEERTQIKQKEKTNENAIDKVIATTHHEKTFIQNAVTDLTEMKQVSKQLATK